MQLARLIAMVDDTKPNQYGNDVKVQWINEIENKCIEQVINRAEGFNLGYVKHNYDEDEETELLIPDSFLDVYINYIYAKIDFNNAEYDRYNNDVALYQASFDDYAAWFRRNNMPKQKHSLGPF